MREVVLNTETDYNNFMKLYESEAYEALSPEEQGAIQVALDNYRILFGLPSEENETLS